MADSVGDVVSFKDLLTWASYKRECNPHCYNVIASLKL